MADLTPLLPSLLDAVSSCNVGVQLITEQSGTYVRRYANRMAAAMFGYTAEQP